MARPTTSDKSLLDRLNALKPSSVSLEGPPSFQTHASTSSSAVPDLDPLPSSTVGLGAPPPPGPVSREDALSARLKSLRQQHGSASSSGGPPVADHLFDGPRSSWSTVPAGSSTQPLRDQEPYTMIKANTKANTKVSQPSRRNQIEGESLDAHAVHAVRAVQEDIPYSTDALDALDLVDDQAVNDLLLDLAAEPLDPEDGGYDVDILEKEDDDEFGDALIKLPDVPTSDRLDAEDSGEDAEEDNSQLVDDLFRSLGVVPKKPSTGQDSKARPKRGAGAAGQGDNGHDSDDSDAGDMAQQIKAVLDQAQAAVDLDRKEKGDRGGVDVGPGDGDGDEATEKQPGGDESKKTANESTEAEPAAETTTTTPPPPPPPLPSASQPKPKPDQPVEPGDTAPDKSRKAGPDKEDDDNDDNDPFQQLGLPSVPTKLVDPPSPPKDAADDIAARLAALRGLGGKGRGGLGQVDAFGLPSVPTADPADGEDNDDDEEHRKWARKGDLSFGRVGYTDKDQTMWCVVCVEDAVVRCLGCDNDAYCARCWREMHVGPAAGFDERGHKRVPIVRRGET